MKRTIQVALAAIPLACSGGGDGGITQPPAAVPGILSISLATPNSDDRAILLTISGPGTPASIVAGPAGYRIESRVTGTTARAAVFGNLDNGVLARFSVPDVALAATYAASVVEAAGPSNALRADLSKYVLSVTR